MTIVTDIDLGGEEACPALPGSVEGTLRFNPVMEEGKVVGGSGFFIAKFIKK